MSIESLMTKPLVLTALLAGVFSFAVNAKATTPATSVEVFKDADAILEKIEYVPPIDFQSAGDDSTLGPLAAWDLTEVTRFFETFATEAHIAHIFASSDLSRFVTVRYDYELKDQSYFGRVIKLPESHFLINTRTRSRRAISIYFEGFPQSEINKIVLLFQRSKSVPFSTSAAILNLFIPQSCAASPTFVEIAKVVVAHPMPFINTIANYTGAKTMVAISSCARPVIDVITALLHVRLSWGMLNPFSYSTAKLFSLARLVYSVCRDLVRAAVAEVQNAIRTHHVDGSRAIYAACAIMSGRYFLKPIEAIAGATLTAGGEAGAMAIGKALAVNGSIGVERAFDAVTKISGQIENVHEYFWTQLERSATARKLETVARTEGAVVKRQVTVNKMRNGGQRSAAAR